MTVRCITCDRFTLKPRKPNGLNESLRELDRKFIPLGLGRCLVNPCNSYQKHSAEQERECAQHCPIDADQVQKRRDFIERRRA